ncbi:hypothetical protein NM688_g4759 [Phlebia brevispora]|uniref:Uncharacterized protein n=1 Tax=Phlebia brevispora TaxID=194682 RepID=A0ACC1T2L7_9APHY|nr:hypothetical protein NM688_g4759 [Phlebia brevispora]
MDTNSLDQGIASTRICGRGTDLDDTERNTLPPVSPVHEQADHPSYRARAKEFVDLHDQVETSVNLLDSLESFLSTFQKDLSAVSGQISDLQDRSKDIENRLKSRRKIERPLSNLLIDLTIPPPSAAIILDTNVGEPWIETIEDFERRLEALRLRGRVKAARDVSEVAEGLRIVACTKLRQFFLNLLAPIRTSMSTNISVIQTSVFLKYRSLYAFLQRQAHPVAAEIQRAYARTTEKTDIIVTGAGEPNQLEETEGSFERLSHARIDGPGPVLAYMADEKTHKEPIEALFRSLLLVLLDNSTAEYSFISAFFSPATIPPSSSTVSSRTGMDSKDSNSSALLSPTQAEFEELKSNGDTEHGGSQIVMSASERHMASINSILGIAPTLLDPTTDAKEVKEEQNTLNAIWKQVMDPVLDYCQTYIEQSLAPHPTIPLLTMIRLTEDVMLEVQKRGCSPLETFIFTIRLKMWPVWQKGMADHIEGVRKLVESATGGGGALGAMWRKTTLSEATVKTICQRYVVMFNTFVALTSQQEETMIFSNLLRLRQELTKLIAAYTDKMADPTAKATAQSTLYDALLQGLSKGVHTVSHPKAQSEIAFWKEREEEARRRIVSTRRQR